MRSPASQRLVPSRPIVRHAWPPVLSLILYPARGLLHTAGIALSDHLYCIGSLVHVFSSFETAPPPSPPPPHPHYIITVIQARPVAPRTARGKLPWASTPHLATLDLGTDRLSPVHRANQTPLPTKVRMVAATESDGPLA